MGLDIRASVSAIFKGLFKRLGVTSLLDYTLCSPDLWCAFIFKYRKPKNLKCKHMPHTWVAVIFHLSSNCYSTIWTLPCGGRGTLGAFFEAILEDRGSDTMPCYDKFLFLVNLTAPVSSRIKGMHVKIFLYFTQV